MKPPPETDSSGPAALDWALRQGVADRVATEVEILLRRRRQRRLLLAGGIASVLVAAALLRTGRPAPAGAENSGLPAANAVVSLPAKRTLPDGTIVELKDGSQITFDYSGSARHVILQQGEAHFAVIKDAQRPFVVEAAGVQVRAVGTAFSVQRGTGTVEVVVTEGRVAVSAEPPAAASGPVEATLVDSGNRCVVELPVADVPAALPRVATVDPREMSERLSWRVPRLEFSGTPLAQAVTLFNRHAGVRLVLADSSLGALELSGVVRADNTGSLLRLLESEFGIAADTRGGEIILRRAR